MTMNAAYNVKTESVHMFIQIVFCRQKVPYGNFILTNKRELYYENK